MDWRSGGGLLLGPEEGLLLQHGGLGIRFMLYGEQTGGRVSVVEHPLAPRALAAPVHTHQYEDEYSFVLEGTVGAEIDGQVLIGHPGDFIAKPRGLPHSFWNAGDVPARVLELITPGGFEHFFIEEAAERYGLTFDLGSVPRLMAEHGLRVSPRPRDA